jgi:MFS family permease
MFDARQSNMQDVTTYAPVRIAMLGILRAIFGLLVALMGVVAVWATASGDSAPRQPGDMPSWWMSLVGLVLGFVGFAIASGGLGRLVSAFAKDCYFRAGPDGLAIRLPVQGWFGRFRLTEYNFQWAEIKQLVHFTHSINLIPVSRELRIELEDGKRVVIQRHYFSASVKTLQQQLLTIRASVGK